MYLSHNINLVTLKISQELCFVRIHLPYLLRLVVFVTVAVAPVAAAVAAVAPALAAVSECPVVAAVFGLAAAVGLAAVVVAAAAVAAVAECPVVAAAVGLVVVAAADPVADRTSPTAVQQPLLHPCPALLCPDVHMSADMLLKHTGDAQAQRRNHNMEGDLSSCHY